MRTIVTMLVLAVLSAGCATAQDTVQDLRGQADELLQQGRDLAATFQWCASAAQLAQAVAARDVEAVRAAAADLRQTAPEELQPDLERIATAAQEASDGNPSALRDEDVQQAARDLYAYAAERCGLADEA